MKEGYIEITTGVSKLFIQIGQTEKNVNSSIARKELNSTSHHKHPKVLFKHKPCLLRSYYETAH